MTPTEIVYALLKEKGWPLAELSRKMGYASTGTMSNRLKRGNPTVNTLNEIVSAMGYEIVIRSKEAPATEFVVTAEKAESN